MLEAEQDSKEVDEAVDADPPRDRGVVLGDREDDLQSETEGHNHFKG